MTDHVLNHRARRRHVSFTRSAVSTSTTVHDIIQKSVRTTDLIIVEDGIKTRSVSVEEIFIAERIIIAVSASGVAEQRVGEAEKRLQSGLESQSAYVDDDTLCVVSTRVARRRWRRQSYGAVEIQRLAVVVLRQSRIEPATTTTTTHGDKIDLTGPITSARGRSTASIGSRWQWG
jgi:hypothetical protein